MKKNKPSPPPSDSYAPNVGEEGGTICHDCQKLIPETIDPTFGKVDYVYYPKEGKSIVCKTCYDIRVKDPKLMTFVMFASEKEKS